MFIFGKIKVAKEEFYSSKKAISIWDVNVNNIAISNLTKTKEDFKYLIVFSINITFI